MEPRLPSDAAELVDNFSVFDDWEDRYSYLIELGERLAPLPDAEKTEPNKVRGCTSQVWFVRRPSSDGRIVWEGDSDASIVRGLIAILQVLYGGKTGEEVALVDVESVFQELGLERHLSMNRRNGFFSMVGKLREFSTAGTRPGEAAAG